MISLLVQRVIYACNESIRDALGDSADAPSLGELRDAIEAVSAEYAPAILATTLAWTAATGQQAAAACEETLTTDPRFTSILADDPPQREPPTMRTRILTTVLDPEKRRARAETKALKRERKRKAKVARPSSHRKKRPSQDAGASAAAQRDVRADTRPTPVPARISRRPASLSAYESARYDREDPLSGSIVWANVVFDGVDPDHPEMKSKLRPAVVIAGNETHLLVRGCYKGGGLQSRRWKSIPLEDWREAGLTQRSWVEEKTHEIPRRECSPPRGALTVSDWNALW